MPVNNFTVGKDLSFSLVLPTGTVQFNGVTDYQTKRNESDLKHKGLDGITQHGIIPDGWEIAIKLDRQDPIIDNLFAQLEAAYFAGQNIPAGSVTELIKEADGSVSQYQYTGCQLKYTSAGDYKGDALVSQGLTILASRRIKRA